MSDYSDNAREYEIIRSLAELSLQHQNELLADALAMHGAISDAQTDAVKGYLADYPKELLSQEVGRHARAGLEGLIEETTIHLTFPSEDYLAEKQALIDIEEKSFEATEDFDVDKIKDDPVWTKESISLLRAHALLLRKYDQNFQDQIKLRFIQGIARSCVHYNLPIPQSVEGLLSPEQLTAILEDEADRTVKLHIEGEQERKLISSEIADEVDRQVDDEEGRVQQDLVKFLERFPDINELIKVLLGKIEAIK